MEYELTNRERNQHADRQRMHVTGRGLLTIDISKRPVRVGRKTRKTAGIKVKSR